MKAKKELSVLEQEKIKDRLMDIERTISGINRIVEVEFLPSDVRISGVPKLLAALEDRFLYLHKML